MAGRNTGGDLSDMAAEGTTVPMGSDSAAQPRYIKSVPRPDQDSQRYDPNATGSSEIAGAATNDSDLPRTARDNAGDEVLTGTGDTLPSTVDSKRLHNVPGGVTHDPTAKGSTRYTEHIRQPDTFKTAASEGPGVDPEPGREDLSAEAAMDKLERKQL